PKAWIQRQNCRAFMNNHLTLGLDAVQNIARGSKLQRLRSNPAKYIYSVFFIKLLYKITKKEKIVSTPLFFNRPMTIALPASTDIYLTGGKSHDSEIRLARFMIQTLKPGDHFL